MTGADEVIFQYFGSVRREADDKCASLSLNASGNLLAAQSTGKIVEVRSVMCCFAWISLIRLIEFRFFGCEVQRKWRKSRRGDYEGPEKKRPRSKRLPLLLSKTPTTRRGPTRSVLYYSLLSKTFSLISLLYYHPIYWQEAPDVDGAGDPADDDDVGDDGDDGGAGGESEPRVTIGSGSILGDELEAVSVLRCGSKVRSFAFSPSPAQRASSKGEGASGSALLCDKALVSLVTNALEVYNVPHPAESSEEINLVPVKTSILDLHGHR